MNHLRSVEELPKVPMIVAEQRAHYVELISAGGLIGFAGGCALTEQQDIIRHEGEQLAAAQTDGLATGQRVNPWKQRTPKPGQPSPYEGLETVDPDQAESIVSGQAVRHGSAVMEVGRRHHVKYLSHISAEWWGSRNEDYGLMIEIALLDPRILFLSKNHLDGDLGPTLATISTINEERQKLAERLDISVAPAMLAFRGQDNARTPMEWYDARMRAYEATGGVMFDDVAHGTMRAHNPPSADYEEKTVEGQLRAWEHVIDLAERGLAGVGVMGEGSDTRSDVDPHAPFDVSLQNIQRMHSAKMAARVAIAA